MRSHLILLAHGQLAVPEVTTEVGQDEVALGTFLSNLAYYGYMPDAEVLAALRSCSPAMLADYWQALNAVLSERSLASRNIGEFVVYKDFPREVLDMDAAQYWLQQICIYLGVPADWISRPVIRPPLTEQPKLKRLALAAADAESQVYSALKAQTTRWTHEQRAFGCQLHVDLAVMLLDVDSFGFKENGVILAVDTLEQPGELCMTNATDVLRLAAGLSKSDISLRAPKLHLDRFDRPTRRFLVELLEMAEHLDEDFAMRPALWKRFLSMLRPGDFKAPKVSAAYDRLYKGELRSFAASVEQAIAAKDVSVLKLLAARPGDYLRRFHALYALFGRAAVTGLLPLLDKLDSDKLLRFAGYLRSVNERSFLMYPPNGNWAKVQVAPNQKAVIAMEDLRTLLGAIQHRRSKWLAEQYPEGFQLESTAADVRLPVNAQELMPFGPGTRFAIPPEISFVRTATYWQVLQGTAWMDNGWNFFTEGWQPRQACCWNMERPFENDAAIFSGDPVNSSNREGKAAQLIDLDLDLLAANGVRYAVWSILSFSDIAFSDAEEVAGLLLWGEDAQSGGLLEPSRAQLVLPVKGASKLKYVALLDVSTREVVMLDITMRGRLQSAGSNAEALQAQLPAYLDYLKAVPSLRDYFAGVPDNGPVLTREQALVGGWRPA